MLVASIPVSVKFRANFTFTFRFGACLDPITTTITSTTTLHPTPTSKNTEEDLKPTSTVRSPKITPLAQR